jgi:hypothetical protein
MVGHLENVQPGTAADDEVTKVENIFYSSSVFGQPDILLIVVLR